MAVARAFPAVARDPIGAPDPAGGEHGGLRLEHAEAPALAVVAECADDAGAVAEERDDRELHVDVEATVDAVVLERPDHLEARAIADVREARVLVPAEVALEDAAVRGPVEERAPRLELAHAVGRFFRVQFGHPPVVDVLAAAHRVGEVHLPAVSIVDVGERGRHAAFRHHGVRLAEE